MPFATDEQLKLLIENVCRDEDEIKTNLNALDISPDYVVKALFKHKESIWATVAAELREHELVGLELKRCKEEYPALYNYLFRIPSKPKKLANVRATVALVFGMLVLLPLIFNFSYGAIINTKWLISLSEKWLKIPIYVFILFLLVLLFYYLVPFKTIFTFINKRAINTLLSRYDLIVQNIKLKSETFANLQFKMIADLKEKAIKEKIRAIINLRLEPSFSTVLSNVNTRGLSEVFDGRNTIDTQAKSELDFLFQSMPGGSIGIAGPRGAGKTTLIRSYCSKDRSVEEINGSKVLPIMTSAPVKYDARDFILHVFSIVCNVALEADRLGNPFLYDQKEQIISMSRLGGVLGRWMRVVFWLLLTLIAVSFIASISLYDLHNHYYATMPKSIAQSDSLEAIPHHLEPFLTYYFKSISKSNGAPAYYFSIALAGWFLLNIFVFAGRVRPLRLRSSRSAERKKEGVISIKESAETWLQKIKFQQTYTSGWSGSLKLPVALEGGMNKSTSMAEKPLSYPEIVQGLRDLLSVLSLSYCVIVGIDELDKLESDEDAKNFLNEIKSIFGVPRCFFLISVSENAIHYFERRGIPIRDAFDSAFDTMIYVNYLNFLETGMLLQRRIIGKPVPFVCLAYCLAGGLPRDIIRQFRSIVKTSKTDNNLLFVIKRLIQDDIVAKARASHFDIRKIKEHRQKAEVIVIVEDLTSSRFDEKSLLTDLRGLLTICQTIRDLSQIKEDEIIVVKKLQAITEELATYLAWIMTVYQLFVTDTNINKLRNEDIFVFDFLAQTRQSLAVDFGLARSQITKLRKMAQLPEMSLLE
jgi:hypothetical protein